MLLRSLSKRQTEDESAIPKVAEPTYELLDLLGKGGFSTVYVARKRGYYKTYDCKYVAKVCDLLRSQEQLKDERVKRGRLLTKAMKPLKAQDEAAVRTTTLDSVNNKDDCKRTVISNTGVVTLPTPLELVTNEVKILRRLQTSSFIVRFVDAFLVDGGEHDQKIWIVMERLVVSVQDVVSMFRKATDLKKKERKKHKLKRAISNETIACIIMEVLKALKVLKQQRVVHCDIKPGNILLSSVGNVKLCDFGIAKLLEEGEDYAVVNSVQGTPQYMASEMVAVGRKFDYSADIWSLGVVAYNLYMPGEMPWMSEKAEQQFFSEGMWEFWELSNAYYFSQLLRPGFLTHKEYIAHEQFCGNKIKPSFVDFNDHFHSEVLPIYTVVRRAMIPIPKHGPTGEINRPDLLDRLTLEEFEDWCRTMIKGIPEFNRLSLLQNLVKETQAAQNYFAKVKASKEEVLSKIL